MSDPLTSNWDIFFRVWAVAGPLLAASASQIWSRRIQVQDRNYETTCKNNEKKQEEEKEKQNLINKISENKYNEIKASYIQFMSSTHQYVRKQAEYLTNPATLGRQEAATEANDLLIKSQQEIILLGTHEVSNAAIDFGNKCISVPKSYKTPITPDYETKLQEYKDSRAKFSLLAKQHLDELLPNAH